jgi:hypothetical protein
VVTRFAHLEEEVEAAYVDGEDRELDVERGSP